MSASQPPQPPQNPDDDLNPVQGSVHYHNLNALIPSGVGQGVFSNGVMILTGPYEVVIDFLLRLGEQQRIAARIVLPHVVAKQFAVALDQDIKLYEEHFGPLPRPPRPISAKSTHSDDEQAPRAESALPTAESDDTAPPRKVHPENLPSTHRNIPTAEDIYDELKFPTELLVGRYANSVLIRHSGSEFCFDFITNIFPRSAVSARVFLATPHVGPLFQSLTRAITPPFHDGPRMA